ncbi:MAG: hypothetical protein U1E76_06270 [Planctomycetota bacterium]
MIPPAESRTGAWTLAFLLVAITVWAYLPVLDAGFVKIDDDKYVENNRHVRAGLSASSIEWALTSHHASNWHPLTWWSLMADAQLFGPGPAGFHRTNLVLHAANVVLLFFVLLAATHAARCSALIAALFAIHPLHVESVAWIAERKDVLSTLFWLLTMAAYLHHCRRPSFARYALVLLWFALGLMAKPMLVTLPLVLLLLDAWPLARLHLRQPGSLRRGLLEKLPLLGLAAASSAVTIWAQRAGGAMAELGALPLASRLANAALSVFRYLGATFVPRGLAVFYPYPSELSPAGAVAAAAGLVVITAITLWQWRRRPWFLFGWLWYLITLLPVVGIVQVGAQAMADRYTYVPLIGVFVILVFAAAALGAWLGSGARRVGVAAAVLVVLWLSWRAHEQAELWHDSETLFRHALASTRDNYFAHHNLAVSLLERGQHAEATQHLAEALRIQPSYPLANICYAGELLRRKQPAAAMPFLDRALAASPRDADALVNQGIALAMLGDVPAAAARFRRALEIDPEHDGAKQNLRIAERNLNKQAH